MKLFFLALLLTLSFSTSAFQSIALNAKEHPAGTRFLTPCPSVVEGKECVLELVISEWAPSKKFVKIGIPNHANSFEWKAPKQITVLEVLPTKTAN